MATEIQFGPSLNAAVATQGAAPEESNPFVQQQKQPAPILGGENVRVTSGAVSDLEKIVARLKNEDDETRTNLTKMRLSAVGAALDQANVRLSAEQAAAFNDMVGQEEARAALQAELDGIYAEYGITVLRVPAYSPYAVAEHAMTILQAANRRIHKSYIKVKDNNFALSGLLGLDLHNKVAGIMGTGRIGQIMANICKGYGMTVLGWDAFPNKSLEEQGLLKYVSKEELLRKADLISLHAPLVMGPNGTYHLIDDEAISIMKDKVMLVNTSRGPLVDPEALIRGLKADKFHCVALDVYEGEDPNVYNDRSDEMIDTDIVARLTMFPNLILTSHQAFFTREALQAIAAVTMENARNFNEGLPFGMSEVK